MQATHLHPSGQTLLPSHMMKITYRKSNVTSSNPPIYLGCLDFEEDSASNIHTFERGWGDKPPTQNDKPLSAASASKPRLQDLRGCAALPLHGGKAPECSFDDHRTQKCCLCMKKMNAFEKLVKSTHAAHKSKAAAESSGSRTRRAIGILANNMQTAIAMTGAGVAMFAAADDANEHEAMKAEIMADDVNEIEGFAGDGLDAAKEDIVDGDAVTDGKKMLVEAVFEAAKCAAGITLFVTSGGGSAVTTVSQGFMGSCIKLLSNAVRFLSSATFFAFLGNPETQPDLLSLQPPGFMDELRWNEEYLDEIVKKVGQSDGLRDCQKQGLSAAECNTKRNKSSNKGTELAQRTASQLVCAVKAMRTYEKRDQTLITAADAPHREKEAEARVEAEAKAMKALKIIRGRMLAALQIVQLDNQDKMWDFLKEHLSGDNQGRRHGSDLGGGGQATLSPAESKPKASVLKKLGWGL